jgi:hypothetical protein
MHQSWPVEITKGSANCKHLHFEIGHQVGRLTDQDDSEKVNSFTLDLMVRCADCGLPFEFVGMPGGFSSQQPMCNFDAKEARIPIRPSSDPAEHVKQILKP